MTNVAPGPRVDCPQLPMLCLGTEYLPLTQRASVSHCLGLLELWLAGHLKHHTLASQDTISHPPKEPPSHLPGQEGYQHPGLHW